LLDLYGGERNYSEGEQSFSDADPIINFGHDFDDQFDSQF
jgi:hypothetical protein